MNLEARVWVVEALSWDRYLKMDEEARIMEP
jgi:hypothetical protein